MITKTKYILTAILLVVCTATAVAQNNVITGTVMEQFGDDLEPIVGANVVLVNSQNRHVRGTVTDINGKYNLAVPADSKKLRIKVSYIGMKTETVNYTGQKNLNFKLESNTKIQEVTVTGQRGGRD